MTIDHLLTVAASRRPDDIALIDPPNRAAITDGAPRTLTYDEADRAVSTIAVRLRDLGLQSGNIVGLSLPNTVEAVLAFLGVLRAGLVASPLPLLWRRTDCAAAMAMIGAQALIASARIGSTDQGAIAMQTAADAFTVRHVCLFGGSHDGTMTLDDIFDAPSPPSLPRSDDAGAHVAAVTWDIDSTGLKPVARNHIELMTAGLEVTREGGFRERTVILSSLCIGSLAGIATGLLPWLLTPGTLVLHHPFDPAALDRQLRDRKCEAVVVPGSLAARCAKAGMADTSVVVAVWRAPERMATCPIWPVAAGAPALMDVAVFGEIGLFAAMRGANGKPTGIRPGVAVSERGEPAFIEAARTPAGTVAVRGPMVPMQSLPQAGDASREPRQDADRFVDTGYPCRIAPGTGTLVVTGPPAGMVGIGGYRLALSQVQEAVSRIDPAAVIAALPDGLTGQRIAGVASRREALEQALALAGQSPLVAGAFRPRRGGDSRNAA
jgi:non-ribosomal peptide synthetase component E (peptide arylation enzyme)